MSQEELAARADVHPTYLSAVECGKRNPSVAFFFTISFALNVSPAELFQLPTSGKGDAHATKKSR
jgi:transcriptional regulator with XRE-family HTH domain